MILCSRGNPVPTLNDLTDCMISLGVPGPHGRAVKRYLYEAGILPHTARGKVGQTEAVHAVALLFANTAHEHQVHAVEALLSIWGLKEAYSSERREDAVGNLMHLRANASNGRGLSFGRQIHAIISATAAWPESTQPPELCKSVMIWRGFPHAQIIYANRIQDYRLHFKGTGLRFKHLAPPTDRINVIASIPWATLLALAQLVAESRALAAKQGVEIEEESTWRALELPASEVVAGGPVGPSSGDVY
jgi:hypothetical protein